MDNKIFLLLAFLAVFVFASVSSVQAFPQPNLFYGTVTVNGIPAPDGVLISAKHQGKDVGGTLTTDGKYFLTFALEPTEHGDTIELYVQGVKGGEGKFSTGTTIHEVNLLAEIANFCGDGNCEEGESCSSCPADCGTCTTGGTTSGGSSSGGSTGGTTGGTTEEPEKPCVEDWICTDWTECFNSMQKRACADVKRCGTEENKPVEVQDCVMPLICEPGKIVCRENYLSQCSPSGTTWVEMEECEFGCMNAECLEEGQFNFTGMMSALPLLGGGIIVLIVIVILAFYFMRIRK